VGVSKWISSHVEKNPHVDLTPIFHDYEKHLKAIDVKVWSSTHQFVCRMVRGENPLISPSYYSVTNCCCYVCV
jgi:hypothetical protein